MQRLGCCSAQLNAFSRQRSLVAPSLRPLSKIALAEHPDGCYCAQAKLMSEVSAMLSSFAEQKAAAVASAVGAMHGALAQGRHSTEASFAVLSGAVSSADDAIKVVSSAEQRTLPVESALIGQSNTWGSAKGHSDLCSH